MVFASTGTERHECSAPVGEVSPVLFPISMNKGDGLWALWETASFAVFQAPVGALFASMGAGVPGMLDSSEVQVLCPGLVETKG